MTEKPVRPSEDPLRVFISSRQDEEMSRARDMAIKELCKHGIPHQGLDLRPGPNVPGRERGIPGQNISQALQHYRGGGQLSFPGNLVRFP